MPRIFTGLEIPADVGQSLAMLRGGLPGARWMNQKIFTSRCGSSAMWTTRVAREVASVLGRVRREPFQLQIDGLTWIFVDASRARWWRVWRNAAR